MNRATRRSWYAGLIVLASVGCATGGATGGGGGGEPNICDAWNVWGASEKENFLVPIWGRTISAAQAPLANGAATPEQIARFNACFAARRPQFSTDVDRACSAPGSYLDGEAMGSMASAHVPTCMREAGILD